MIDIIFETPDSLQNINNILIFFGYSTGQRLWGGVFQAKKKIVIVDDEELNCLQLYRILSLSYDCYWTTNSLAAIAFVLEKRPDLIVLDYTMPGLNGIDLCVKLREKKNTRHIPIVFVSGILTIEEKIRAFENGASDFIVRPFHAQEMLLRIRARLCSKKPPDLASELSAGNLKLHPLSRRVYIQEKEIFLTQRQFDILKILIREQNQLVARTQLMREIWGTTDFKSRKVDSHISHLKIKIKEFDGRIATIPGIGYCLETSK